MSNLVKNLLQNLHKNGQKGVAWLVDPDKEVDLSSFQWVQDSGLDLILVGGSTSQLTDLDEWIERLRKIAGKTPICIFPGSYLQICRKADALMFLSLLSGRNPEYLIGQQIKAAEEVANSGLEILPTAYILVNEGEILSVHSLSQTLPILNSQAELVVQTALAGTLLGMKYVFLDAGSGAKNPVDPRVIGSVKKKVEVPLIIGGGLSTSAKVRDAFMAGADLIVLGNQTEKDPGFLAEVLATKRWYNHTLNIN